MMTKRITLALVLLAMPALIVSAQSQTPTRGKTVAVVIGVSKYPKLGGGQQLQFADHDAQAMAEALRKAGVSAENLRVMVGPEATAAAIKSAIGNWLAHAAGPEDTAVIFFSGHGISEQEFSEAYLLGADSDAKDLFATAVSFSDIQQALAKRVHARQVLLITDAIRKDFFDPETNGTKAASFIYALDQMTSSRVGLSVISASGPNEFSREGQRWNGQGVFTRYLASVLMADQSADRNGDGTLTADELVDAVAMSIAEDTANKQHVWRSHTQLGQIALASVSRNAVAVTTPQPRPSAPTTTPSTGTIAPANTTSTTVAASMPQPSANTGSSGTPTTSSTAPVVRQPASSPVNTSTPSSNSTIARSEPLTTHPAGNKGVTTTSSAPVSTPRTPMATPPATTSARPVESAVHSPASNTTAPVAATNPPPRSSVTLPTIGGVTVQPEHTTETAPLASTAAPVEAAPSPMIMQFEAAIAAKQLLEPRDISAWDLYQKINSDPATASEAARLRPMLVDALIATGRSMITDGAVSDHIADRTEDFRRAGQMLARARSLRPDQADISTLEKLSAAQALIALQFYDEAERALTALSAVKLAAIENAMGLVQQGKLDNYRAERAFKRAVEIDPNWAVPHYNLALLYRDQQNGDALAELEKAATLDAKNATMQLALGDEYFAKQQWQQAAESYRKAVALKPNDDTLHTKLGHALYSQGLQAEANREYQRAQELRKRQQ